jgi:hypothetical protein
VLRAIALGGAGLQVEPQVGVDDVGRPDLLDRERGLVIEADSFEDVMLEPGYVQGVLDSVVALLTGRPVGLALESVRRRRSA